MRETAWQDFQTFVADTAIVNTLSANIAQVNKAFINYANITNSKIENLQANIARVNNMFANYATIGQLNAVDAKFKNITVSFANVTGKLEVSRLAAGGYTATWNQRDGHPIIDYDTEYITDGDGKSHKVVTGITLDSTVGYYIGRA